MASVRLQLSKKKRVGIRTSGSTRALACVDTGKSKSAGADDVRSSPIKASLAERKVWPALALACIGDADYIP